MSPMTQNTNSVSLFNNLFEKCKEGIIFPLLEKYQFIQTIQNTNIVSRLIPFLKKSNQFPFVIEVPIWSHQRIQFSLYLNPLDALDQ